jgi:hypothetical protein
MIADYLECLASSTILSAFFEILQDILSRILAFTSRSVALHLSHLQNDADRQPKNLIAGREFWRQTFPPNSESK